MLASKGLQNRIPQQMGQISSPPALRQLTGTIPMVIIAVLLGLFLVWRPIQVARLVRDIEQLNRLKAEVLEINTRLKLERATLSRLDRVESLARKDYGFIDPNKSQVIDIFM